MPDKMTGRLSPMTEVATPVQARASLPVSGVTRLRALEVLGDTDTWTGSDWQHAAIHLASAIVALTGDLDDGRDS